jgi:hypothetical protein
MTAKNKQLLISESHDDLNRCTLCRKNLIHTTHTLPAPVHVSHSYTSYGQSPYVATFHTNPTELNEFTVLKKVLPTSPLSMAEWSAGPALVSLPIQILK